MWKFLIVGVCLVLIFGYPVGYRMSTEEMTILVTDKERINDSESSKFLVYTKQGVFENTDSWLFFKFNSSDFQNKLEVGEKYKVKVAGWRLPFFSTYKNIITVKKIKNRKSTL